MHTRSRVRRVGPVLAAMLLLPLLAAVGAATQAGAAPSQIPTPFTAVGSGGILALNDTAAEPTTLPVPHPAREAECQDGIDNESGERISGGAIVPALDGLIDNGTDPQCSTTTDASELAASYSGLVANPQPKEATVFAGTRSGNTVSTTSRVFPKGYLGAATTDTVTAWWVVQAELSISATSGQSFADGSGNLTVNGSVVAKFARQSCSGFLCFGAPNNGTCANDTGSPGVINFTTETSGALTGQRYDDYTKTMVLVSDGFTIPGVNSSAICDVLESTLGLGQPNNQAAIALSFNDTTGCGTSPVFNTGALCWEPVLDASAPATAAPGDTVTLDGSLSYDPGYGGEFAGTGATLTYAELTTYTWTQVSGPAAAPVQTGKNADVTFPSAGVYQYQLSGTGNPHYPDPTAETVTITVSAPSGDISGTVSDGGGAVSGIVMSLYPNSGSGRLATTTTDGSGNYAFTGLDAGSYKVRAFDSTGAHTTIWYDGQEDWASGADIVVTGGNVTDADFSLVASGVLWGRLLDSFTGDRAAGVQVQLYDVDGSFVGTATTGTAGYYQFPRLPASTYLVRVNDPAYVVEWFKGQQFAANAQPVTVTAGGTVVLNGADDEFVTPVGTPELSGNVDDGVNPIAGAAVRVYTANGLVGTTTTDGSGNWSYGGINPGTTYYVRFGAGGFQNNWWDNAGPLFDNCAGQPPGCVPTITFADPIVFSGTALTNIDGTLVV